MANSAPAPRKWLVEGDPLPLPPEGDVTFEALAEAWQMLHRLGGSIIAVAQREHVQDDLWVTTSIALTWKPYSPAQRPEPPQEVRGNGSEVTVEQG